MDIENAYLVHLLAFFLLGQNREKVCKGTLLQLPFLWGHGRVWAQKKLRGKFATGNAEIELSVSVGI